MLETVALRGIDLDQAVAVVERILAARSPLEEAQESFDEDHVYQLLREGEPGNGRQRLIVYSPSTSWRQGGPIIERERINLTRLDLAYMNAAPLPAGRYAEMPDGTRRSGDTQLIAAMRAFVASKMPN